MLRANLKFASHVLNTLIYCYAIMIVRFVWTQDFFNNENQVLALFSPPPPKKKEGYIQVNPGSNWRRQKTHREAWGFETILFFSTF
jgi:hypothetical protein